MTRPEKECIIIGSGQSLLDLTPEEKQYLSDHPRTLALNKYLLFHEKIGVVPTDLFLADHHFPAQKVFIETIAKAQKLNPMPTYYASRYFERLFVAPGRYLGWNLRERIRILKDHKKLLPLSASYPRLVFFNMIDVKIHDADWAESLKEHLYYMRSSLTMSINLAYIIYPGADIKLVGVDLKEVEPFYEEEYQKRADLMDKYYRFGKEQGRHFTTVTTKAGSVLTGIARARRELAERGIRLTSASPESALISEKVLDYSPLLERG